MSKKTTLLVRTISLNFLLLLLLPIILFQTCSDDNSLTEPEAEPSLATATIGSSGGTLKTDDFELSVPLGAFPSASNLTLKLVENSSSGIDNIVSSEFQIEGLPENFSQPLTIKIKYSGELTDSSFIAIGENLWVSSLNEETISYKFLSTKDSSGYLVAKIGSTEDYNLGLGKLGSSENGDRLVRIHAASSEKIHMSSGNKFKIYYNSSINKSNVQNIGVYLERAYSTFETMGFKYDRRTLWPVEVYLEKMAPTTYGFCCNALFNDINIFSKNRTYNTGYIKLNSDLIANAEEMKTTIGHEFFHLVQGLYDTRGVYAKTHKPPSPNYWIKEASSVWAEGLLSDDLNYVSDVFSLNSAMVLYGANDSNIENAKGGDYSPMESYGYAMAAFIKYITEKYGEGVVVKIYDEIYKGNNSFEAIEKVILTHVVDIWNDFIKQYLEYNIYNGEEFIPGWLVKEASVSGQNFVIRSDTDTIKTYSKNYRDLSTRIYSIRAISSSLSSIDDKSKLVFDISGNITGNILLFKENDNECVLLQEGKNSVTLDNFKTITDAGYVIIAAVSNSRLVAPYTGTIPSELTIRVKKKEVDTIPVITEIFDSNLFLNVRIKRNFSILGKSIIIKGKNFKDDQKVFINEVEIGSRLQNESEIWLNIIPPEIRGHVKIKILTDSGESNVFPYLFGLPIDYLSSSDSLTAEFNFIPKANDYLGEPIVEPLPLFSVGFSKNEIHWTGGSATVDIGNGDDITGSLEVTFSSLENSTISSVVIDYEKTDSYSLHYEYLGNDYLGGWEDYYNGPNGNLAVYSKFFYSHNVNLLQPSLVSGHIRKYNPVTEKYYDIPFYELDLSATTSWIPIKENSMSFKVFNFKVD